MKKKISILFTSVLVFSAVFCNSLNYGAGPKEKIIKITILYSNSSNNYLEDCKCPSNPYGGIVRRATLIKQIKAKNENVLLFDTGDMLSAYDEKLKSGYMIKSYEYLKYDGICIGDQEFTSGIDFFQEKIQKLPIVLANFQLCKSNMCYLIGDPFEIFKIKDIKVGVIGVISKNAFKYYSKDIVKQIKIDDPLKTIKHYLKLLKSKCEINILLSHSGLDEDKKLARQIQGIDLIIGGHSQNLIKEKMAENNTLIVQAGKNGEHLGEVVIYYDKGKSRIIDIKNKLIPLGKKIEDDAYIRMLIEEYTQKEMEK